MTLDERGKAWRSQELARNLTSLELDGISRLSLLIGGAEGLSQAVRQRADASWRLSDLTLPHELARLLLPRAALPRRDHPRGPPLPSPRLTQERLEPSGCRESGQQRP